MKSQNKTSNKSQDQAKKEILEDWVDVRQWIDDLQQDWSERNEACNPQKEMSKKDQTKSSE